MEETPRYRLAAVWFADLVGYSELAARNEPEALARVRALQEAVREVATAVEGRVVKFLGDGALAEFPNTLAAVEAALSLSDRFHERVGAADAMLRIGIHVGDVAPTPDGDLYGDGVNLAARLQHEAEPGQIVASEDVWNQIRRHPRFGSVDLGTRPLKGVGEVRLRALHERDAASSPVAAAPAVAREAGGQSLHRRRNLAYLGIGAVVALAGTGIATWVQSRGGEEAEATAAADSTAAARDTVVVVDTVPAHLEASSMEQPSGVVGVPLPGEAGAPPAPTGGHPAGAEAELGRRTAVTPEVPVPPRIRRRVADAIRDGEVQERLRARRQRAEEPPPEDQPR